jgi:phospholipase D1/2
LDGPDEKAAMRRSDEAPSPTQPTGDETFPSLDSTLSPAGETEKASQPPGRKTTFSSGATNGTNGSGSNGAANTSSQKKRRRGTTKGSRKGFSAPTLNSFLV